MGIGLRIAGTPCHKGLLMSAFGHFVARRIVRLELNLLGLKQLIGSSITAAAAAVIGSRLGGGSSGLALRAPSP